MPSNDILYDLDKYVGAFNFRVTVDGIKVGDEASFKAVGVSNIQSESELVEYKLGHEPFVRKIPGRSKFSEFEITRVYQGYDQMYAWRARIEEGFSDLRNIQLEVLDPSLETAVLKLTLTNCWPVRWQLPNLDASSTAPAIETITMACEQVKQSLASPKDALANIDALTPDDSSAAEPATFSPPEDGDAETEDTEPTLAEYIETWKAEAEDITEDKFDPYEPTEWENKPGDGPLLPSYATWEPPEPVEDPTAEQNGGDGEGPLNSLGTQEEADYGDITEDTFDPYEPTEWENKTGDGPLLPSYATWKPPGPADDPTAARNGGDGQGPLNSLGVQEEADYGEPGSGPLNSLGAQEEADYGSPGDGPKSGLGAQEEADYGSPGDGPILPTEES